MPGNEYQFTTRWVVPGTITEVFAILEDAANLVRWWPSVYLEVRGLEGEKQGEGARYDLLTKGWLPYTLSWRLRVVDKQPPNRLALAAEGDLVGSGLWTLRILGSDTEVIYDWHIRAEKPLLRYLSFMLKPLFRANHEWAMAQGEKSLRLELARRRARTEEERAQTPAPPAPTPSSISQWLIALALRRI